MADLRRLAITCDFGEFLNQALRDRFVCGLKSEQVQKCLLAEADLTIKRAVELAQAKEAASRDAKNFKSSSAPAVAMVHQVPAADHSPPGSGEKPCYRCGKTDHAPAGCKFRQAKCHRCGKVGHIAPVCKTWRKPQPARNRASGTRYVESAVQPDEEEQELAALALTVGDKSSRSIQVDVQLAGRLLTMELDTGAAVSLISKKTCQELFPNTSLRRSTLLLRTYTGEVLKVAGEMTVEVRYEQQTKKLNLVVIEGNGPSLFGRNWLRHIQLNWKAIAMVSCKSLVQILHKYDEVFRDELGTIHPFVAELSITPGASSKFCRARPVPFSLRPAVEEELDRLESQGVLEKNRLQ